MADFEGFEDGKGVCKGDLEGVADGVTEAGKEPEGDGDDEGEGIADGDGVVDGDERTIGEEEDTAVGVVDGTAE